MRNHYFRTRTWPGLLWLMALLGLLLLPSDYRAGAEMAHPHAFVQLWADAQHGSVQHHHRSPASVSELDWHDWFDPAYGVIEPAHATDRNGERPDVGEHHDSIPATSGVHLLHAAATLLPALAVEREPFSDVRRPLIGRSPRILLPPPRWTFAAT